MKQFSLVVMLAICLASVMGGVMKRSTIEDDIHDHFQTIEDRMSGLNFFDQFQSMFGWGEETTTTPRPTTPRPAHFHTATVAPYYGGRNFQHPSQYPPQPHPVPMYQARPSSSPAQPGGPPQELGQAPPPPSAAPLKPGQAPVAPPSYKYPPVQYPPPPQYHPYPPQSYYYPSYYPPQYPPMQSYYPNYYPQAPHPQTYPTPSSRLGGHTEPEAEEQLTPTEQEAKTHQVPNKHKAVPNKASLNVPELPLPFPVTKSKLPISILPPEDCHTADDMIGECLSASECGSTSGHPSGLCHMGRDVSLHARVCCIYPAHCGFETNHRVTYMKSPNYPHTATSVSSCPFTVNLLPGVCQVRLDFLDFHMKPLNHGICDPTNSMTIKSSHSSTMLPMTNLCGTVATGKEDPLRTDIPHLYAHFDMDPVLGRDDAKVPNKDTTIPSLQLQFNVTNYPSKWNIRVSQIVCDGANLQAPSGCAQYYNSNSGNITSFNLPDRQYMADTSLDACVARDPTACAIKYSIKTMGVGPTKGGGMGYGLVCNDYIKFNGEKTSMCGKGEGRELVLSTKGPMGLSFRSDSSHIPEADVGFRIEYAYQHDCSTLQNYKYPVSK